jgi:hypothetical protein
MSYKRTKLKEFYIWGLSVLQGFVLAVFLLNVSYIFRDIYLELGYFYTWSAFLFVVLPMIIEAVDLSKWIWNPKSGTPKTLRKINYRYNHKILSNQSLDKYSRVEMSDYIDRDGSKDTYIKWIESGLQELSVKEILEVVCVVGYMGNEDRWYNYQVEERITKFREALENLLNIEVLVDIPGIKVTSSFVKNNGT